jgi:hypothetical protein
MNASNFARASGDADSNADLGVPLAYVTEPVPLNWPSHTQPIKMRQYRERKRPFLCNLTDQTRHRATTAQ